MKADEVLQAASTTQNGSGDQANPAVAALAGTGVLFQEGDGGFNHGGTLNEVCNPISLLDQQSLISDSAHRRPTDCDDSRTR